MRYLGAILIVSWMACGCTVRPGNSTAHLVSINYSILRRPALVYEQFEHRPPHTNRVEYFRWLHGSPINPNEITAIMSSPAYQKFEVTTDPSANFTPPMLSDPGGYTLPSTSPPLSTPELASPPEPASTVAPPVILPENTTPPSSVVPPQAADDGSWLELFQETTPPSPGTPHPVPAPPQPGIQTPQLGPLFPDHIPPLAPKEPMDQNITQAGYTRPLPAPKMTSPPIVTSSEVTKKRVSSRLLFPTH